MDNKGGTGRDSPNEEMIERRKSEGRRKMGKGTGNKEIQKSGLGKENGKGKGGGGPHYRE